MRIKIKDQFIHPYIAGYWPKCLSVDRMNRAQLLELQENRLRELMQHAIRHVPFYRPMGAAGGPRIRGSAPSERVADCHQDLFRANLDAFQSEAFSLKGMSLAKTSGSSGEPFLLRLHRSATDYSYACLWRALSRHGLRPGDRRVYVWGRSFLFNSSAAQRQKIRLRQKVRNWLNNTMAIDAYELTHRNVDQAIEAIEQFRPIYLHGYVSALYTIARRMVETNRSFRNFRPLAVITESEKLFDFQQETMQHAFGCKLLEHYGSVECGTSRAAGPRRSHAQLPRICTNSRRWQTANCW